MNAQLLNPFTIDIPDSVSSTFETAECTVCQFNHGFGVFQGQYLAVGRSDGWITIWDIETKSILRLLSGHVRSITGLAWSSNNRFLASCSGDWNVIIWDLAAKSAGGIIGAGPSGLPYQQEKKRIIRFDAPVIDVQFAPGNSRKLLVVLSTQQAYLVDVDEKFRIRRRKTSSGSHHTNGIAQSSSKDLGIEVKDLQQPPIRTPLMSPTADEDGSTSTGITAAKFTQDSKYIVAGTSKGSLYIFDPLSGDLIDEVKVLSTNSGVKELSFDASGRFLVVNCNDRALRVLSVTTSSSSTQQEHQEERSTKRRKTTLELTLLHKIQDMIQRSAWNNVGFSPDSEYIFAGAAHKASHNVYIWDRSSGVLAKILEGPKDWLIGVDWHPTRPMLASISNTGTIYVWFTPTEEIWSAYAPGFEELEENVEYEEKEDEFDFIDNQDQKDRRKQEEEEAALVRIEEDPKTAAGSPRDGLKGPKGESAWELLRTLLDINLDHDQQENAQCTAMKMLANMSKEIVSDSGWRKVESGWEVEEVRELVLTAIQEDVDENFVIPPRLEDDFSGLQDDHP